MHRRAENTSLEHLDSGTMLETVVTGHDSPEMENVFCATYTATVLSLDVGWRILRCKHSSKKVQINSILPLQLLSHGAANTAPKMF